MEINGIAHTMLTSGNFAEARPFYSRLLPALAATSLCATASFGQAEEPPLETIREDSAATQDSTAAAADAFSESTSPACVSMVTAPPPVA